MADTLKRVSLFIPRAISRAVCVDNDLFQYYYFQLVVLLLCPCPMHLIRGLLFCKASLITQIVGKPAAVRRGGGGFSFANFVWQSGGLELGGKVDLRWENAKLKSNSVNFSVNNLDR